MDSALRQLHKTVAWMVFVLGAVISTADARAEADVRILIDVSGSMKHNDPTNLRIPAVRLVAELMPRGATAGIWTFSEAVEPIIPAGEVDAGWKADALEAARKIHSRGQFTDIESAIAVATRDWDQSGGAASERHLIVLTDGMVDVSKQAADSAASRERLIGPVLARIKAHGVQIHTIALSANSDRELLTTLAENTEGWAEQVDDAASLQRVFLHMFEQAANPDSVPLLDNRFEVDASVSEMTLLVFRAEAAAPLQLVSPQGALLDASSRAGNVNWRAENGYDLVTVQQPDTGTWQINTEPDPDNRVLIVTDLKLEVDALPTNILTDEALTVSAHITERDRRLVRQDFLKLLRAELAVTGSDSEPDAAEPIPFDPQSARFVGERVVASPAGDYEFIVRVDGGTFQREQRSKLRIHAAPVTFSSSLAQDGRALEFSARAAVELIELDSLSGLVIVERPDGSSDVHDLPAFTSDQVTLSIPAPSNGIYRIEPRLLGRSASGRAMNIKGTPLTAEVSAATADPAAPVESQDNGAIEAVSVDWLRVAAIVLIANAFVAALLACLWFMLGQRKPIPTSQVVLQ